MGLPATSDRPVLLLVEDEPDDREVLHRVFSRLPLATRWRLLFARTCREAQDLVRLHAPAAVVSDFHLPDGTGLELLHLVQREVPSAKRVILTGTPERLEAARSLGPIMVQQVWDKNWGPMEIFLRLQTLLQSAAGGGSMAHAPSRDVMPTLLARAA